MIHMNIRRLIDEDIPQLRDHWKNHGGDEFVVAHGVIYRPDTLDRDEWVGEVTYVVSGDDAEIVSIDSLRESQGIGKDNTPLRDEIELEMRLNLTLPQTSPSMEEGQG